MTTIQSSPPAPTRPAPVTREERSTLSSVFPIHVDFLRQQRSAHIPATCLEGYLSLGWMRWAAGRLLVTPQGAAVRDSTLAREAAT